MGGSPSVHFPEATPEEKALQQERNRRRDRVALLAEIAGNALGRDIEPGVNAGSYREDPRQAGGYVSRRVGRVLRLDLADDRLGVPEKPEPGITVSPEAVSQSLSFFCRSGGIVGRDQAVEP